MAGGNWRIIKEKLDLRVVKQQDNLSCGVACGEMLLKERGIGHLVIVDGFDSQGKMLIRGRGKEQVIKWRKRNLLIIGRYEVLDGFKNDS